MTNRPMIFDAESIRAILAGVKTQTRRLLKPQPHESTTAVRDIPGTSHWYAAISVTNDFGEGFRPNPVHGQWRWNARFQVGDRIWVKEAAIVTPKHWDDGGTFTCRDSDGDKRWVQYVATSPNTEAARDYGLKVNPASLLVRWASRITLEITRVRAEQVQNISEEDAMAEGCGEWAMESNAIITCATMREVFSRRWDALNAKRGYPWSGNWWVWVYDFKEIA